MKYDAKRIKDLKRMAVRLREDIIEMIPPGKIGHLGGSCSAADIVTVLYFDRMKGLDPKNPKAPQRDRLILSKGHAVLVQYAGLSELGYFGREELLKVKTLGGMLQGHPDIDKTPGLEAVTGSLGQGLSVSQGIAMALKLDKNPAKVFCICGDGELAEGQIWEAAMSAAAYKLDNLCVFIDRNKVQATGPIDEILPVDNLKEKWTAFGWHVIEIDGHDISQILDAVFEADKTFGVPTMIIANTVKGKGFPFAEGKAQFHNAALNEEQFAQCKKDIETMKKELEV
ncbi:transketolase [Treponema parvum]|uniref:transketolase n=1 Tax=Treponema parvum TaxID=138851 RepID=UPI001AEC63EC|nr:transketolase [Treponema parvum]QTQ15544.1 transketolase [Treponema parvum]